VQRAAAVPSRLSCNHLAGSVHGVVVPVYPVDLGKQQDIALGGVTGLPVPMLVVGAGCDRRALLGQDSTYRFDSPAQPVDCVLRQAQEKPEPVGPPDGDGDGDGVDDGEDAR
jgi:hypothetical protein